MKAKWCFSSLVVSTKSPIAWPVILAPGWECDCYVTEPICGWTTSKCVTTSQNQRSHACLLKHLLCNTLWLLHHTGTYSAYNIHSWHISTSMLKYVYVVRHGLQVVKVLGLLANRHVFALDIFSWKQPIAKYKSPWHFVMHDLSSSINWAKNVPVIFLNVLIECFIFLWKSLYACSNHPYSILSKENC